MRGPGPPAAGGLRVVALVTPPLLLAAFAALYALDRQAYRDFVREDGIAENMTVACFLLTAIVAAAIVRRARAASRRYRAAFVVLACFAVFSVLEELSWGQRIVGWESPAFFKSYSRQRETNVHNVVQKLTTLKVKDVAPVVFVLWGVALPLAAARSARVRARVQGWEFLVPPLPLVWGFLLGSLLMLDQPTGREEELGELVVSAWILLYVGFEWVAPTVRDGLA